MGSYGGVIVISAGLLFTAASFASWIGLILAIVFVRDATLLFGHKSNTKTPASVFSMGGLAVVLFLVGVVFTKPFAAGGFTMPIFWYVMPWTAWISTALTVFALWRLGKLATAITAEEKVAGLKAAGVSLVVAIGLVLLYRTDPDNKITILKGGIPFSFATIGILFCVFVLSMISIAWSYKSASARGITKTIATQLALLAGSVVFGIPFLFLLITSFKEDRDMSAKTGIIWIPRVTDTVPFINPDPLKKHYMGDYNGREVEAVSIGNENGKMKMDIFRPLSVRGISYYATRDQLHEVPVKAMVYTATVNGTPIKGFEKESLEDGRKILSIMEPDSMKGKEITLLAEKTEPVRHIGLRTQNYSEAIQYLPLETSNGLVYLKNTLLIVVLGVIGTILSCSIVAYSFSRLKFPGKDKLFNVLLATMMLPGAVTLLPQFLIFRTLGWVDTLYPLWVPAFFGSAFNIFLLRQFFSQIPMELEDAAKIDGCSYIKTFWAIMMPQIKPALAVIAVGTFLGAWNNFMGPLIYINSPEHMPISYALQLFKGDRDGDSEPGLLMAFTSMTVVPVVAVFFFAQKYFIEGVTLSGFGGR
jgi:multiple sugar transport system permease protein